MKLNDLELSTRKRELLSLLEKQRFSISDKLIKSNLSRDATQRELERCISSLIEGGYDIQTIIKDRTKSRQLVRYVEGQKYYRPMGRIEFPILLTSDWHIGHKGWSELAFRQLVKDIKTYKVKHLIHLGDLIQGLGVHSKELQDLSMHSIDEQVEASIDYLKEIPKKTQIHLTLGSHEEALKGKQKVGFDAGKFVASALPNVSYYGMRLEFLLRNGFSLVGYHSRGGMGFASSYRLERIWGELVEKPEILAIGHHHRLFHLLKPPRHLLMEVGTLCREGSYVYWRGITAQIGWYIIEDYEPEKISFIARRPKVY